jgi:hypothetical protein
MASQPLLYTLLIQLEPLQLNPPIWRRVRISGDCTLRRLHHFIQAAMGWHSSHLHEFNIGMNRYTPLDDGFMGDKGALDDRKFKLRRLLEEGDRARYVYDFGDGWQHVIAVESIHPFDYTGTWCEVVAGENACPPEDVGGVPGYQHFLESIARPDSEEGQAALEWIGGSNFAADRFDLHGANAAVQRICNNMWG